MKNSAVAIQQNDLNSLSEEAMQILDILDQIENHTAALRRKLVSELSTKTEAVHLELSELEA